MFWQVAKTVCCLILVFCTGCASIPSAPQVRIPSFLQRKETNVSEEKETKRKPEKEEPTPKRKPLIALNRSEPAKLHDAATQRLIAEELADATPAEHAEWTDFLASIETSMVPYVLQSRRVNRTQRPPGSRPEQQSNGEIIASDDSPRDRSNADTRNPNQAPGLNSEESNPIELVSREEMVISPEEISSQQKENRIPNERDWSGKLKSLTEWEKNPLNFTREGEAGAEHNKSRHLPKIISNPFQRQEGEQTETKNSPSTLQNSQENQLAKTQPNTPDSLRITPGAKLWEEELNKLVSLMEAEASASGMASSGVLSRDELRKQVALRMLYLVNDQTELAMQPIPGLQTADQEFWITLFWGLSSYLNENGLDPTERSTKTIEQLRSATHYLQMASKLQLRNVSFCSKIDGFGSYDQFVSDDFSAGQPVLIYCDIRNFQSEPSDDGFYVTKLRSSLEIYEGGVEGRIVERNPFPATEDRCRSVRSDYYHSYRIDLPQTLTPGPHLLKLTIHDEFSGKSATEFIRFKVK
ncbi:MAG: hypothetical protein HON04_16870 [Planctomicrobium sp.]|jgi:hypothetical protein|nr:hypothetical protein [Planctomicrobium sp.]